MQSLVVQTGRGFSLVRQDDYYGVFEGNRVRGPLHTAGRHEFEIVGESSLSVIIEDWAVDLIQAKWIFYRGCPHRPQDLQSILGLRSDGTCGAALLVALDLLAVDEQPRRPSM